MSNRKIQIIGIVLLLFSCAACSSSQRLSAEDKLATAQFIAATILAQTEQASIPTITNTSQPTETPIPTTIITETPTMVPTISATETSSYISPTPTETPFLAAYMVTPLKFINQSGKSVYFLFTSPIQDEYTFTSNFGIKVPFGTYHYLAWIGDEGPFSGSVEVRGYDKIEMIFRTDKVKIVYP